jgi:hypothetical protein
MYVHTVAGVEKYELKESDDFLRKQKERVREMERQAEMDFALRNAEYDDDYDDQVGLLRRLVLQVLL